jgi:hypothetical protein
VLVALVIVSPVPIAGEKSKVNCSFSVITLYEKAVGIP